MAMTVDEIKSKRLALEKMFTDEIKAFEKETSTRIGYVSLRREEPARSKSDSPETVMPEYDYDNRPLMTVDFELRFVK